MSESTKNERKSKCDIMKYKLCIGTSMSPNSSSTRLLTIRVSNIQKKVVTPEGRISNRMLIDRLIISSLAVVFTKRWNYFQLLNYYFVFFLILKKWAKKSKVKKQVGTCSSNDTFPFSTIFYFYLHICLM